MQASKQAGKITQEKLGPLFAKLVSACMLTTTYVGYQVNGSTFKNIWLCKIIVWVKEGC